jgi:hypothetical protein
MSKPNQYTAAQMIEALTATRGMITFAARRLGCAPNTIRRYIKEYPTVAETINELREMEGDAIEIALYDEGVNKRNYNVLMFLAKTKHKGRGYVERTEQVNFNVDTALIQRAIEAIEKQGLSASDVFESLIASAAEETHSAVVGGHGAGTDESAG